MGLATCLVTMGASELLGLGAGVKSIQRERKPHRTDRATQRIPSLGGLATVAIEQNDGRNPLILEVAVEGGLIVACIKNYRVLTHIPITSCILAEVVSVVIGKRLPATTDKCNL